MHILRSDWWTREVSLRQRLPHVALYIITVGGALAVIWGEIGGHQAPGVDSHAYWHAWRGALYTTGHMTRDAYLYSPAFAQAIWPLALVPWFTVFAAVTAVVNGALLIWLLRPLGWRWMVPLAVIFIPELINGNIVIPLAVMAVLGFRYPGVWAFSALTKVAPTVMPLWWLMRREWRPVCIWAGTTAAIIGVSALAAPGLWWQWVSHLITWATTQGQHLLGIAGLVPLPYRAPVGLGLIVVGARRDWRWAVPVAALLCTPVISLGSYAWLTAIPRIQRPALHHPGHVEPLTGSPTVS